MPTPTPVPPVYRYERKFLVDQLDAHQAVNLVKRHPALFSEIYPPRQVNNIYLDSHRLEDYFENIDGSPRRKKTRVRWYHDLFREVKDPVLEIKIKDGLMGTKISHPFAPFRFGPGFGAREFKGLVRSSPLPPEMIDLLLALEPVLVNSYQRRYFATPDRSFRVTIDEGLTYYHLTRLENSFLFHQRERKSIVLELKYARGQDEQANRISSGFPFRMTRSSKYVRGIEWVYL